MSSRTLSIWGRHAINQHICQFELFRAPKAIDWERVSPVCFSDNYLHFLDYRRKSEVICSFHRWEIWIFVPKFDYSVWIRKFTIEFSIANLWWNVGKLSKHQWKLSFSTFKLRFPIDKSCKSLRGFSCNPENEGSCQKNTQETPSPNESLLGRGKVQKWQICWFIAWRPHI